MSAKQAPLLVEPSTEAGKPQLPPVHLDQFEGPLDVLLHLIREQKLDIFDIPIALLTQQYLDVIARQQALNLEIAGEYLVMASTLTQLKSRLLLPRPELDEEGNAIDPRAELTAQLLAYEQFRVLAEELNARPRLGRDLFARSVFPEASHIHRPLPEADLDALLVAFHRVLKRVGGEVRHQIFRETMSTRAQMGVILERLQQGSIQLDALLDGGSDRALLVTSLLAILELWRQQAICVVQSRSLGPITLLTAESRAVAA